MENIDAYYEKMREKMRVEKTDIEKTSKEDLIDNTYNLLNTIAYYLPENHYQEDNLDDLFWKNKERLEDLKKNVFENGDIIDEIEDKLYWMQEYKNKLTRVRIIFMLTYMKMKEDIVKNRLD